MKLSTGTPACRYKGNMPNSMNETARRVPAASCFNRAGITLSPVRVGAAANIVEDICQGPIGACFNKAYYAYTIYSCSYKAMNFQRQEFSSGPSPGLGALHALPILCPLASARVGRDTQGVGILAPA